jgi:hypothetical protein
MIFMPPTKNITARLYVSHVPGRANASIAQSQTYGSAVSSYRHQAMSEDHKKRSYRSRVSTIAHVLATCVFPQSVSAPRLATAPALVEGTRSCDPIVRRVSKLNRTFCCSLFHESVSQATSKSSWLPDHRKSSRARRRAMAQVHRVAKEVRSVRHLYNILISTHFSYGLDQVILSTSMPPVSRSSSSTPNELL